LDNRKLLLHHWNNIVMAKINLELTEQEAQVLMMLIDTAVKSGGLQVAEAGVVLSYKLREAAKPKVALPEQKEEAKSE
jgi:hypothetical protein